MEQFAILPERLIVMEINKKDILGYLVVLNSAEVWDLLTDEERHTGRCNVLGCYLRLITVLEKHKADKNSDLHYLYMQVEHREYLNAKLNLPVGHPKLVAANKETSLALFNYLRSEPPSAVKIKFLDELDSELKKILETQQWRTQ